MKQRTILLVACLMTIPAATAQSQGSVCAVGDGLGCIDDSGVTRTASCRPVEVTVQVSSTPDAHADLHPECLTGP